MRLRKIEFATGIICLLIGISLIFYDFYQNKPQLESDQVLSEDMSNSEFTSLTEFKKGYQIEKEEKSTQEDSASLNNKKEEYLNKISKPSVFLTELVVKKNERISFFLKRHGLNQYEIKSIIKALSPYKEGKELKRGERFFLKREKLPYTLILQLQRIIFLVPPGKKFTFIRQDDNSFKLLNPPEMLPRKIQFTEGKINDSLFVDGLKKGLSHSVINKLGKIFSYSLDLQRSIKKGDRFEILVEKAFDIETNFTDPGSILYAVLYLKQGPQKLYRFNFKESETEYFNEKGEGVRKALLQTPIKGARISSGFGKRMHPIQGYTAMHRGIDFAAHTGSPVLSAGDGHIKKMGYLGTYGNYILVSHTQDYSTAYAHLSRYGKNLKKGMKVKQGQVIGHVGATGRATGPHLHYEVHYKGNQINPKNIKMPSQRNLSGRQLQNFLDFKRLVAKKIYLLKNKD